jgi:hypothetical protein
VGPLRSSRGCKERLAALAGVRLFVGRFSSYPGWLRNWLRLKRVRVPQNSKVSQLGARALFSFWRLRVLLGRVFAGQELSLGWQESEKGSGASPGVISPGVLFPLRFPRQFAAADGCMIE